MNASDQTIDFLRRLTLDGFLTGDEVWSLGKFLMDHPACAEEWPGNVLAPMIESAFDDSSLSEEEMTLLAETIGSIEEEWRLKHAPAPDRHAASDPVSVRAALIPVINAKFEIPSRKDESYMVGLTEHTCTCPDWTRRKGLALRHPGKCCKHVAHAFTRTGKIFEPWFQALLDDCFAHGRGTNPALNWVLLDLPRRPALVGSGTNPWSHVFAPGGGGYAPFAFNREQGRWSFGVAPEASAAIERAIRESAPMRSTAP